MYYPTAAMLVMRNFHGTTPIIYQMDGALYGDTALDILVDSEATVEGFTELTELFTLYDLPVDVPNFYQHFRNGDLPIGIADFNSYNLILNAAPDRIRKIVDSVKQEVEKLENMGKMPIIITSPIVRIYFKKMINDYVKDLTVVSYNEIESNVELQSVGMVTA